MLLCVIRGGSCWVRGRALIGGTHVQRLASTFPLRTKGSFTTLAGSCLSRITTCTTSPGLHARRHPRERDRFLHRRRKRAARDFALAVRRDDFLVSTQHATGAAVFLVQDQSDEIRLLAVRLQRRACRRSRATISGRRSRRGRRRAARRCRPCPGRRGSCRLRGAACRARRDRPAARPALSARSRALRRAPPARRFRSRLRRCSRCARRINSPNGVSATAAALNGLSDFGGGARVRQHLPDFFARVRALHGDDRQIAARRDRQAEFAFGVELAEPRDVLLGGAGVDDDAEVIFARSSRRSGRR